MGPPVERRDRLPPVARDVGRAQEVVAVEPAAPQCRQVEDGEHDDQRGAGPGPVAIPALAQPRRQRGEADAQQHREAEHDERNGPGGATECQPGGRVAGERPERPSVQRRVGVRVRADRDHGAHNHQCNEEDLVLPAGERRGDERHRRDGEPDDDQPDVAQVVAAGLDPRTDAVAAVEVPVPEAAQYLGHARTA